MIWFGTQNLFFSAVLTTCLRIALNDLCVQARTFSWSSAVVLADPFLSLRCPTATDAARRFVSPLTPRCWNAISWLVENFILTTSMCIAILAPYVFSFLIKTASILSPSIANSIFTLYPSTTWLVTITPVTPKLLFTTLAITSRHVHAFQCIYYSIQESPLTRRK